MKIEYLAKDANGTDIEVGDVIRYCTNPYAEPEFHVFREAEVVWEGGALLAKDRIAYGQELLHHALNRFTKFKPEIIDGTDLHRRRP